LYYYKKLSAVHTSISTISSLIDVHRGNNISYFMFTLYFFKPYDGVVIHKRKRKIESIEDLSFLLKSNDLVGKKAGHLLQYEVVIQYITIK